MKERIDKITQGVMLYAYTGMAVYYTLQVLHTLGVL
ncbi:hypothetical protein IK7_06377 [Bacillus cereus VD156]|nr:hypothetical protein IK7_06377 [Bacillus cereus VD156]